MIQDRNLELQKNKKDIGGGINEAFTEEIKAAIIDIL